MNRKVNILGKSFYSPSLKDVSGLERVELRCSFAFAYNVFPRTASIHKLSRIQFF